VPVQRRVDGGDVEETHLAQRRRDGGRAQQRHVLAQQLPRAVVEVIRVQVRDEHRVDVAQQFFQRQRQLDQRAGQRTGVALAAALGREVGVDQQRRAAGLQLDGGAADQLKTHGRSGRQGPVRST